MKEHYFLYLIGALLICANISILFHENPSAKTQTSITSDGLIGVVIISCAFIFGRHNREIAQLRATVERLHRKQVSLCAEVINEKQNIK